MFPRSMSNHTKKYRKYCIVPCCSSNSIKNPEKVYVRLPGEQKRRSLWLSTINRHPGDFSTKTCAFVCEDHFNLEHDMLNYEEYKQGIGKVRMRSDSVPHIFTEEWRQQSKHEPVESYTQKRRTKSHKEVRHNVITAEESSNVFIQDENRNEMDTVDFDDIDSIISYDEAEYVYVKPESTDDLIYNEGNDESMTDCDRNKLPENKIKSSSLSNISDLDEKIRNIIEQQREQIEQEKLQIKDVAEITDERPDAREVSCLGEITAEKLNRKNDLNEPKEYINSTTINTPDHTNRLYQNNELSQTECNNEISHESSKFYYTEEICDSFPSVSKQLSKESQFLGKADDHTFEGSSQISGNMNNQVRQLPEIPTLSNQLTEHSDFSCQLPNNRQDVPYHLTNRTQLSDPFNVIPVPHQLPDYLPKLPDTPLRQNIFPEQGNVSNSYINCVPQYSSSALDNSTTKAYYNNYTNDKSQHTSNESTQILYPYHLNLSSQTNSGNFTQLSNVEKYPSYWPDQNKYGYQNYANKFLRQSNVFDYQNNYLNSPNKQTPTCSYLNTNTTVPRETDVILPQYLDVINRTNQIQWFKCDLCNQSFMGKYALYRHSKMHVDQQADNGPCHWKRIEEGANMFVHEKNFRSENNP